MHGPININPLNAELNPICHLLALLGAHLIFHVSRIRVKSSPNVCISSTHNPQFYRQSLSLSHRAHLSTITPLETATEAVLNPDFPVRINFASRCRHARKNRKELDDAN